MTGSRLDQEAGQPYLVIRKVTKRFGAFTALQDIDLEIRNRFHEPQEGAPSEVRANLLTKLVQPSEPAVSGGDA